MISFRKRKPWELIDRYFTMFFRHKVRVWMRWENHIGSNLQPSTHLQETWFVWCRHYHFPAGDGASWERKGNLPSFPVFFFLLSIGIWTQDLTLARQALYYLSHSVSPVFVLGIFGIGFLQLFVWGWPQILILLISASWVARITSVSQWHLQQT
jgi:hypothetical protein